MRCDEYGNNYFFVDDGDQYCFSYGQLVAMIRDGEYIEFQGDRYFSQSSCRHKAKFRKRYNVRRKK